MLVPVRPVLRALGAFFTVLLMASSAALPQSDEERRAWQHAQAIGRIHDYAVFIERYPDSAFAQDATKAIVKLATLAAAEAEQQRPHTYHKTRIGKGGDSDKSSGY